MGRDELKGKADELVDILGDLTSTTEDREAAHIALLAVVDQIEARWQERVDVRDVLIEAAEGRILSLEAELFLLKRSTEDLQNE